MGGKGTQIITNETSGRFGGVLGALGFMNAERGARIKMNSGAILAPLGRLCVTFWRPLDFEGPIRLVFLEVFGAVTTNPKIINKIKASTY